MELFAQLPWRRQILEGLLGADLVGFQTALGARNFAAACRRFTEAEGTDEELEFRGRRVSVGTFPISIDFEEIDQLARTPSVQEEAARIRDQVGERKIILGVDRLDYTKGIDHRLNAFETHLERYANSAEDVVFIQVAVPSRQMVQEYADMRTRIEQQVGRINGTWGEPGRVAVHYLYRNLAKEELIAYYLAAHVMAVTPLRDGMNLVAKEYVAARTDDTGVLVLSEFAGAAAELSDAVIVNPYDIDRLAEAFDQALDMRAEVAMAAMRRMRSVVRTHDVRRWAGRFLEVLNG
jgi:trehalose-6-phosphate synthase